MGLKLLTVDGNGALKSKWNLREREREREDRRLKKRQLHTSSS